MAHPNEDLIRKMYEAADAGDIPTFQQLFSPEVVWHEPGKSPVSGDFKGIQELLGLFGKTLELSAGTFKLDLHDLLVNDEHAVGLNTASAQRNGKAWSDNQVNVFHIEDGKITEFWNHPRDLYAKDEFWS
jgi:ketosteroid isomerase-like protein